MVEWSETHRSLNRKVAKGQSQSRRIYPQITQITQIMIFRCAGFKPLKAVTGVSSALICAICGQKDFLCAFATWRFNL
jgi:hypothetical protein